MDLSKLAKFYTVVPVDPKTTPCHHLNVSTRQPDGTLKVAFVAEYADPEPGTDVGNESLTQEERRINSLERARSVAQAEADSRNERIANGFDA